MLWMRQVCWRSDEIGLTCYIGNPTFETGLELVHVVEGQVVKDTKYPAALVIGTEAEIQTINGKEELISPLMIFSDAHVGTEEHPGMMVEPLAVPADPLLVGSIVCFQWLVDAGGGNIKSSNIIGVVIRDQAWSLPPGTAAAKSSGGRLARVNPKPWDSRSAISFRNWMQKLGTRKFPRKCAWWNRERRK